MNAKYLGFWQTDKQSGFGLEVWPHGSSYIGEYLEGAKDGVGVLSFEENGGYIGEFSQGTISGVGTFYFKDGRKYEGNWYNNKMNGYGTITWPDGKYYEGEFSDDRKEGFGIYYSLRKIYMGNWKNSVLDGEVIIIDKDKTIKKQLWENGNASKNLPSGYNIIFEKYIDDVIDNKAKLDEMHARSISVQEEMNNLTEYAASFSKFTSALATNNNNDE